jgi:AraC family transcriptional regulator of arabinose operon
LTHPEPLTVAAPLPVRLLSPPTYWRCEPAWSWHSRPLPDFLLWCVLDGVGELSLDGRQTALRPGVCAVFAPGDAPVAEHDPQRRLLVFGMHFGVENTEPADTIVPPGRWQTVPDRDLVSGLARRCDASFRRGDALGMRQARLGLEHLLCLFWEDNLHPVSRVDERLAEIAQAIRQDPGRSWTVAELAARAALSRAQFTRRFTAYAGQSPIRYLTHARVDRARHLLTETELSVAQVAAALGYADVGYFGRQYKQHTGHPPSRERG